MSGSGEGSTGINMVKKYIAKNFFCFIFILWYSTEIIFSTTLKSFLDLPVGTVNSLLNWLVFLLLIIQTLSLLPSYTRREIFLIAGITVPVALAAFLSGNRPLLSAWMFIVAAKNEDPDRIIGIAYKILLILVPAVIAMRFFGLLEDNTLFMRDIQRFSLGFAHPNTLGVRVLQLIICRFYLHRRQIRAWDYLFAVLAVVFVYKIPNSQTVCICLLLFMVLLLFYKCIGRLCPGRMVLYAKSMLAGAFAVNIFSIILSFMDVMANSVLAKIDQWMTCRFSCGHRVLTLYGISFLGRKIYVSDEERELAGIAEKLWLDNAYMSILLRQGVLVFLIFSVGYLWLMKYMAVQKRYVLLFILFLFSVYGIMEAGMYTLGQNVFLIFFADLLYRKRGNPE